MIASGPSAVGVGPEKLRGRVRALAVNSSYRLVPWADALYATDYTWWRENQGARDFAGLKWCSKGKGVEVDYPDVRTFTVPPTTDARRPTIIFDPKGTIGSGGNSGFQALNIAAQTGARRILLIGFDMTTKHGKHWHKDHSGLCRNPREDLICKWRKTLDSQANVFKARGIDVVNVSPISALREYRRASLEEVMAQWNVS